MVTHKLMGSPCLQLFSQSMLHLTMIQVCDVFLQILVKSLAVHLSPSAQLAVSRVITMASGYSSTAVHHDHV